jgi:hypothetical protein
MMRMSTDHLTAWRENVADRVVMLWVEPQTLIKLIDEVIEAREATTSAAASTPPSTARS